MLHITFFGAGPAFHGLQDYLGQARDQALRACTPLPPVLLPRLQLATCAAVEGDCGGSSDPVLQATDTLRSLHAPLLGLADPAEALKEPELPKKVSGLKLPVNKVAAKQLESLLAPAKAQSAASISSNSPAFGPRLGHALLSALVDWDAAVVGPGGACAAVAQLPEDPFPALPDVREGQPGQQELLAIQQVRTWASLFCQHACKRLASPCASAVHRTTGVIF